MCCSQLDERYGCFEIFFWILIFPTCFLAWGDHQFPNDDAVPNDTPNVFLKLFAIAPHCSSYPLLALKLHPCNLHNSFYIIDTFNRLACEISRLGNKIYFHLLFPFWRYLSKYHRCTKNCTKNMEWMKNYQTIC